jgi:hypothetical protein
MATHSAIIKARAEYLATLEPAVSDKITEDMLRAGAVMMNDVLGNQNYGNYVTMFAANTVPDSTEYHLLSDGEKKLLALEEAEAYYLLSILVVALKEVRDKTVVEPTIEFGQGRKVSSMFDAQQLAKEYIEKANSIISTIYSPEDVVIVAI